MHRFFIPQPYSDTMTIMGVDARHIYTVLRMQCGSRVQIVSDDGVTALAEIADANESVVTVKCLEVLAESHEPSVRIVLAQGLAKGEKCAESFEIKEKEGEQYGVDEYGTS